MFRRLFHGRVAISLMAFVSLMGLPLLASFPAQASDTPEYVCDQQTFPSADDSSFRLDLPFSLKLGEHSYSDVFASTNGVLSFGTSDATYWAYPNTPSISVAGWDWVTWGDGAFLRYGTTESTLCVDWSVRPFPDSVGSLTHITLKVALNSDGTWDGEITSSGWLPPELRRGIRFQPNEDVVPIEATFSVGRTGVPVQTQTCWDGSVIPVTDTCPAEPQPEERTEPVQCTGTNPYTQEPSSWNGYRLYLLFWDGRIQYEETVQSACDRAAPSYPIPLPVEHTRTVSCEGYEPVSGGRVTWTAEQRYELYWDGRMVDLESQTAVCNLTDTNLANVDAIVVLENGVEITLTVAQALTLFDSPSDMIHAIFTNPGQVITAIANIGADMSPEQKKRAFRAMVPAVIVSQIVQSTNAITLVRKS